MENHERVNKGLLLLRSTLAPYIARELRVEYGDNWWSVGVLDGLRDHQKRNLPLSGDWANLVDSLDILNCLTLISDAHWQRIFSTKLSKNHRTWANELKEVRVGVAHITGKDFSDNDTWRAIDTMQRLVRQIDSECADEISNLQNSGSSDLVAPLQGTPTAPSDFSDTTKSMQDVYKQIHTVPENSIICKICGSPMVEREGPYSRFLGCSAYPNCKNTQSLPDSERPKDLDTVVLISCSSSQRKGTWKARELYCSASFKESLEFAQKLTRGDDCIFVISSKYGLLDLEDEVENYNVRQKDKSEDDMTQWGVKIVEQIVNRGIDINCTEFIILAWGDYYLPLLKPLKYCETPLQNVRVHDKSAKLREFLAARGK